MTRPSPQSSKPAGAIVLAGLPVPRAGAFDPAWALVAGRPVCAWVVDTLAAAPQMARVALVVDAPRLKRAQELIAASGWRNVRAVAATTTARGANSAPQVAAWLGAGLAELASATRAEVAVVLHDATRPLLDPALLDALFARWDGAGVVAAASRVKETMKVVDERRRVLQTPPRDSLWQVRPPVLMPHSILERVLATAATPAAQQAASSAGIAALVARTPGIHLRLAPAGHDDLMVRRRADLRVVERLLAASGTQVPHG